MGGGSGLRNGATVTPLPMSNSRSRSSRSSRSHNSIFRPLDNGRKSSKNSALCVKPQPPVGLENVGNTCYANAVLQCLLSSALSHALLDPSSTRIFRRYSSNPDLLSLGSGSVDSDEDEYFWENRNANESSRSLPTTEISTEKAKIISAREEKLKAKRREARKKRREQRKKMKGKLLQRETCQWLTGELTDITRLYTALPFDKDNEESKLRWSNLLSLFETGPDGRVVDPGGITRKVDKLSPGLRPYQQEDAHEFLRSLLSTLTLDGHNRKLSSLFDGLLESAVTCQKCHRASITRDRYMDLSLDIQGDEIVDLRGALDHFTQTELLDSNNKVYCERCKAKRVVSKGLRLATAPSILVCHLKRFAFDLYGRTTRLRKSIKYPLKLEIGDFMSRANQGKPPPYELVGVVVHAGTRCESGHYYAIVRNGNDWYKANDGVVTKVTLETALNEQAYILIYEVAGMRAKHGFDGFQKYHEPKTRSRGDESISSYSRNTDDPTVATESCASQRTEDINQMSKSKMAELLDSILNICGSNSVADAVRDAMCDSDRVKADKKKKAKIESASETYLKKAKPLPSTSSVASVESLRQNSRQEIFRIESTSRTEMYMSPTNTNTSGGRRLSEPHLRPCSEAGMKDLEFLRTKVPLKDAWKNNDYEASALSTDLDLIKSVSSNNLLEKEEEVAIGYEKEQFENLSDSSKENFRTKTTMPLSSHQRVKSDFGKLMSIESENALLESDKEEEEVLRPRRPIYRHSNSAPRAGMRERARQGKSLPPLPRRIPRSRYH